MLFCIQKSTTQMTALKSGKKWLRFFLSKNAKPRRSDSDLTDGRAKHSNDSCYGFSPYSLLHSENGKTQRLLFLLKYSTQIMFRQCFIHPPFPAA